jgi:hypothetical protein
LGKEEESPKAKATKAKTKARANGRGYSLGLGKQSPLPIHRQRQPPPPTWQATCTAVHEILNSQQLQLSLNHVSLSLHTYVPTNLLYIWYNTFM